MHALAGKRILLVIAGGIAAYKCLELIRRLRERGASVRCILTAAGREFVTPLSIAALTEDKVYSELFSLTDESEMGHIRLSREADLVVVAPATADLLARMAAGIANDLATTALLATDKPVLAAPAMNVRMWQHPATQANLRTLIGRGVGTVGPNEGDMACGEWGPGRMAEPEEVFGAIEAHFARQGALGGRRALVTSGPTREPIDPVRYISNRSSGKMGYGLAMAALRRGAAVTLISGPTALTPPAGAVFVPVQTAEEMREAVLQHLENATIIVKAAAVADYRARHAASAKIKGKHDLTLELTPNADILAEVAARRTGAFVVGFAAETNDVAANARAKLEAKGIDLLVANDVSRSGIGFDADDNEVLLLDRWGGARPLPRMPKTTVADAILSHVLSLRAAAPRKTPA
jgi:phosphopantothenoylcysteine decarboxylase / phosphopantothenate---cysteine ligase